MTRSISYKKRFYKSLQINRKTKINFYQSFYRLIRINKSRNTKENKRKVYKSRINHRSFIGAEDKDSSIRIINHLSLVSSMVPSI